MCFFPFACCHTDVSPMLLMWQHWQLYRLVGPKPWAKKTFVGLPMTDVNVSSKSFSMSYKFFICKKKLLLEETVRIYLVIKIELAKLINQTKWLRLVSFRFRFQPSKYYIIQIWCGVVYKVDDNIRIWKHRRYPFRRERLGFTKRNVSALLLNFWYYSSNSIGRWDVT